MRSPTGIPSAELQARRELLSGVYAGDVGGFRHSDTVVVTPDGIDVLTDYPSDLESLIVPV